MKLCVLESNLFDFCDDEGFDDKFDLIVFNPPYLPGNSGDVVSKGFQIALDGRNQSGDRIIIDFLQELSKKALSKLQPKAKIVTIVGGWALETGLIAEWLADQRIFQIIEDREQKRIPGEFLTALILEFSDQIEKTT